MDWNLLGQICGVVGGAGTIVYLLMRSLIRSWFERIERALTKLGEVEEDVNKLRAETENRLALFSQNIDGRMSNFTTSLTAVRGDSAQSIMKVAEEHDQTALRLREHLQEVNGPGGLRERFVLVERSVPRELEMMRQTFDGFARKLDAFDTKLDTLLERRAQERQARP